MVAWSNGIRVHIVPSQLKRLHDEYQNKINHFRLQECHIYSEREVTELALRRSRLIEEYSDYLWGLDHRIASFRLLILAAEEAIIDSSVYIDCDEVAYSHPNLVEFRRLAHRCRFRVRQDPRFKPIFLASNVYSDYNLMERTYLEE